MTKFGTTYFLRRIPFTSATPAVVQPKFLSPLTRVRLQPESQIRTFPPSSCQLATASSPRFHFARSSPALASRVFSALSNSAAGRAGAARGAATKMFESLSLRLIPNKGLYVSTPTWWLESRFHFSFAEYYNPKNQNFGVLRVLNDDLVQPRSGFGKHPHRDMEILTYVVDGHLTHKDSMGSAETLGRGAVQYMSAGTGVTHSEMNNSDELLRFLQIWIMPDGKGYPPNYGSRSFAKEDRHNKLQQVVTSFAKYNSKEDTHSGIIPVHQDVSVFVAEMDPGVKQILSLGKGRQAYGVCIEGTLSVGGGGSTKKLEGRDAIEVVNNSDGDAGLVLEADSTAGAHVLFIEMPQ